jgi:hypothetical protein
MLVIAVRRIYQESSPGECFAAFREVVMGAGQVEQILGIDVASRYVSWMHVAVKDGLRGPSQTTGRSGVALP